VTVLPLGKRCNVGVYKSDARFREIDDSTIERWQQPKLPGWVGAEMRPAWKMAAGAGAGAGHEGGKDCRAGGSG
jgi:hypothetical protein